jgi:hypothetical protein
MNSSANHISPISRQREVLSRATEFFLIDGLPETPGYILECTQKSHLDTAASRLEYAVNDAV